MNALEKALASDIIWATLVNRIKVGDTLEFSNERMLTAIRRQLPLNETELTRLLDSPITLRRYRHLMDAEKRRNG